MQAVAPELGVRNRLHNLTGFARRVVSHFLANKGVLLAGAVAYNTLLSMVPLLAIFLVILTRFFERAELISVVSTELELVAPGQASAVVEEVERFLDLSDVIGSVGLVVLVFFSSIAFKILEDAMGATGEAWSKRIGGLDETTMKLVCGSQRVRIPPS